MKKIVLLSLITAGLMADVTYGTFTIKKVPLSTENLSFEHGGTKNAIDAYSDGIGVFIIGATQDADNGSVNKLVYKYGEKAKKEGKTLSEYVLQNGDVKAKMFANKMRKDIANSAYHTDGDACDDGNPNTVNDQYMNQICMGENPCLSLDNTGSLTDWVINPQNHTCSRTVNSQVSATAHRVARWYSNNSPIPSSSTWYYSSGDKCYGGGKNWFVGVGPHNIGYSKQWFYSNVSCRQVSLSYSCPTGYTLSGTKCNKTVTETQSF